MIVESKFSLSADDAARIIIAIAIAIAIIL